VTADIDKSCEDCRGKCCVKHIEVHPGEPLYANDNLTVRIEGFEYNREMRTDAAGRCICLADGRCSIYAARPIECRLFEVGSECCKAIKSGSREFHECKPCKITAKAAKMTANGLPGTGSSRQVEEIDS
jgi:Fe-S-cluster containining protein